MPRTENEERLAKLESTQAELRENIEASKELIARSDKLLDRHRADLARDAPDQPSQQA